MTTCDKIFSVMNFPKFRFGKKEKKDKVIRDYKQELLLREGREQFKTLLKRGLSVPVALL